MKHPTARTVLSLAALALVFTAGILAAGPLNPPAGPVASSYKTLTEVEPRIAINAANTPGGATAVYRITQPGSYYLTANLIGVLGKGGIAIAASDVSVDLNGFAVQGVAGSADGVYGALPGLSGITVRNGAISGWGSSGIDLAFNGAENTLIEAITSRSNGVYGIRSGAFSTIRFCTATRNLSYGIIAYDSSTIDGCVAVQNSSNGLAVGLAGVLRACLARDNGGNGISCLGNGSIEGCSAYSNDLAGIYISSGTMVQGCSATSNGTDGILAVAGCHILNNSCSANGSLAAGGAGIHVLGGDNRVEGNNCTSADRGIEISAAGNVTIRNICSGNTTDWVIAANNAFGPIIDRRAPANAAISGFSGVSSLGSTDANANFSY